MKLCQELFQGFWLYVDYGGFFTNRRRALCLCSTSFIMWFMELYKLITVLNKPIELIPLIYIDFGLTVVNIRACMFMLKRDKFLSLFDDMEKWRAELLLENDAKTVKDLQDFIATVARCSKYFLRCIIVSMFYFASAQIFTRNFVIEIAFPGVDLYESPYYYIVTAFESLYLSPFGLITYSAYMFILLVTIYFGIFLMKDIQYKLESMQDMDEIKALKCIKTCLRRHAMIIKYRQDLEELFSFANIVDVSFFCSSPCIILFYATMEFDLANLIRDLQLIVMKGIATFLSFWLANIFRDESMYIAQAAYNSYWTGYGKEFRRYILVLIAISQRPLELTAGGIKPMNMEFLTSIVRATYSFFTILKGTV